MKASAMLVTVLLAVGTAVAGEYVFDSANPLESYGEEVAVAYSDGGAIVSMTVTPTGAAPVRFSGDEMSFADKAQISIEPVDGAPLVFSNSVSSAGTLCVSGRVDRLEYNGGDDGYLGASSITVLENATLDLLDVIAIQFSSKSATGYARARFVTRGPGWLETQFQFKDGAQYVKCAKVRFEQSGDDVVAKALYGRYTAASPAIIDFDTLTLGTVPKVVYEGEYKNVGNSYNSGYTGNQVFFLERKTATVRFEESFAGSLDLAPQTHVEIGEKALSSWSSVVSGSLGEVLFDGGEPPSDDPVIAFTIPEDVPPKQVWRTFAVNQKLSEMVPLSAKLAGSALISSKKCGEACVTNYTNSGKTADLWLQFLKDPNATTKDGLGALKAVHLEFRQSLNNVEMRAENAYYLSQPAEEPFYRYGTDMASNPLTKTTTYAPATNEYGYCVYEFKAEFPPTPQSRSVTLQPKCALDTGTYVATGNVAIVAATDTCLPQYGDVIVKSGAGLYVGYSSGSETDGVGGGQTALTVESGARIWLYDSYAFHPRQRIVAAGGSLDFGYGSGFVSTNVTGDVVLEAPSTLTLAGADVVRIRNLGGGSSLSATAPEGGEIYIGNQMGREQRKRIQLNGKRVKQQPDGLLYGYDPLGLLLLFR